MQEKIHELTMLYLNKTVDKDVSIKDLARLYYETRKKLEEELGLLSTEAGIKTFSFT